MKVLVAGASGAIGRRLVPLLVARGYQVVALARSPQRLEALRGMGAEPVVADALDRSAVLQAVQRAAPEVVLHELTALTGVKRYKHFDDAFAVTNRLRTVGTTHLLDAAQAVGVRRFIAQSFGNWTYARTGAHLKTEADPLDPTPPRAQRHSLAAIRFLEEAVLGTPGVDGIVLRYGNLYGPGTSIAADGDVVAAVRQRAVPVVGNGAGVWSFLQVDDAAAATLAALHHGAPGIYNVADDEPAPVSVWLPDLAKAVGAKPPRHLPVWLARPFVGDVGVSLMTQSAVRRIPKPGTSSSGCLAIRRGVTASAPHSDATRKQAPLRPSRSSRLLFDAESGERRVCAGPRATGASP